MSQPDQPNSMPDDLLADFTDRVLDGKTTSPASPAGAELHGLEETVLRLRRALPRQSLDEKTIRRMQANFKGRLRKADSPTIPVWRLVRPRPRLVLAFAAVALAVLVVALPALLPVDQSMEGTAGLQPQDLLLWIGVLCALGLLLWARRHK